MPLLAVLRDHLDEHLLRTGRTGEELVFGRTAAARLCPPRSTTGRRSAGRLRGSSRSRSTRPAHLRLALIDSGANAKAVQEFMGHSKIQTTFDTYGH